MDNKNRRIAQLFVGVLLLTLIKIALSLYSGYSGVPVDVFSFLVTEPIRYILILVALIFLIRMSRSQKRKVLALTSLSLLLLIGFVPTGHYLTWGALLSIQNANPEHFRDEARLLINKYRANIRFSDVPPRVLNQYQRLSPSMLPLSILNANIGEVFVFDHYVFIEKFGLGGSFRGFIVFREDTDLWKDEQSITRLKGCSYCWRVRILDGLYWYHALPVDEEDAVLDFLAKQCIIAQCCPTRRAPDKWDSAHFQAVCGA